ncbi:MAG: LysR family transcriptional regulator [Nannocystales bacterium]
MELRHLRYFVAVAQEGSFSAAADRLHISQPPLSRQVRELEGELEVTLFERGRHGARLTAAGAVFEQRVTELFTQLEQSVLHAREVAAGKTGRLRIGYSHAAANALARAVRRLREDGCEAWIELDEMTATAQLEALRARRIDLALGYRLPSLNVPDVHAQAVVHSAVRLVVPKGWRRRVKRDPSVLSQLPLLFLPQAAAPTLHAQALDRLREQGIVPHTVRELRSARSVLLLIGAGDGFGLIPESIDVRGVEGVEASDDPVLDLGLDTWAFWINQTPVARRLVDALGE